MNYLGSFQRLSRAKRLATFLVSVIAAWAVGLPGFMNVASAGSLTLVSDTISNSAPGETSNHVITFNAPQAIPSGATMRVTFDPDEGPNLFSGVNTITLADLAGSVNFTPVAACGGGSNEATFTTSSNPDYIEFTVCPGDTIPAGTTTISIGGNKITNPSVVGSYVVRINGTMPDVADTRIAIVNAVTVSAAVDTTLTFRIIGLATSTDVNGDLTTGSTSPDRIEFGRLVPGVAKVMGQDLTVQTNARAGFVVTVIQNQNLLSNTGADIDVFQNGNGKSAPVAWTAPSNTLGNEDTYGHYGITSEDADLNGDEFGTALYAGNFATTSRVIFSHNGPADGVTPNIGSTSVAFRIEIGSLQEAATDYTNRITYVCTPTF
jgi:hypothetical protein